MDMRKYIRYILCLPILLCGFSCTDFIDVTPENSVTFTNYFKTRQDAEALLITLENRLRNAVSCSSQRHNIATAGEIVDYDPNNFYMQKFNDIKGTWNNHYTTIYQANLIIDNAHRFEISEEELRPYLLQAYFAKGVAYLYLAMNFGEVPIMKESTNYGKLPQSPITEVLDEAEKWALKAMDLPKYEDLVKETPEQRMKQHGSKGAAAALLAHIYAWKAGVEGKNECWSKAEEYCRMIIEGEVGTYKLPATPEEVCINSMHGNSDDAIWEIYYNSNTDGVRGDLLCVGFPIVTTSAYLPHLMNRPSIFKSTVRSLYDQEDLRREAYFWQTEADSIFLKNINGEIIVDTERGKDSIVSKYDNQAIQQAFLYKFRYPYYTQNDWSMEPDFKGMDQYQVIWRLSEIYLLRAECRARQGKANAAEDLNEIRRQAFGNDDHAYPCADDVEKGLTNNLPLAIFREREKELLHEQHRYFDIVRNGWCYLRGEDSHDYIRKELAAPYAHLTDQDIKDGALYYMLLADCFLNNDLIRQNKYWNRRQQ